MPAVKPWSYINGTLHLEKVSLSNICQEYSSPTYVYAKNKIIDNFLRYSKSLNCKHKIYYAVKANSNLAVLNVLAQLGAGFDTVSLGEISRINAAQINNSPIIFSGVGKRKDEIIYALKHNIHCINVESLAELERIDSIAKNLNLIANVALRINPNINSDTHPLIATGQKQHKFGLQQEQCDYIFANKTHFKHVQITGISYHIGSQITNLAPFEISMHKIKNYILELYPNNTQLKHLNIGGGLGIRYHKELVPQIEDYTGLVNNIFNDFPLTIYLEPGRSIVAEAGLLITQVEYIKDNFIIVDAGMNDIIRPCLYDSWHNVIPLLEPNSNNVDNCYDIVGPLCESSDVLATNRNLTVKEGEYLCLTDTGAYCFTMNSNYNSRPKAAEVMVDNDQFYLIRAREEVTSLYKDEFLLPM